MKMNLDDPKLTAYALGEELPPEERRALEQAIADSDEAQAFVRETQQLARLLRHDFAAEQEQSVKPRNIMPLPQERSFWSDARGMSIAVAALLAIALVVGAVVLSGTRSRRLADQRTPETFLQMEVEPAAAPASLPAVTANSDRGFVPAADYPRTTFPFMVGMTSYAEVRRALEAGKRPARDAVRAEELINYFTYNYPPPEGDRVLHGTGGRRIARGHEHRLVRIGVARSRLTQRGPSNLVFLLDVSGSMGPRERLPLIKQAMRLLVDRLTENDRVAIVVYAGASGLVLPSTPGNEKEKIIARSRN